MQFIWYIQPHSLTANILVPVKWEILCCCENSDKSDNANYSILKGMSMKKIYVGLPLFHGLLGKLQPRFSQLNSRPLNWELVRTELNC